MVYQNKDMKFLMNHLLKKIGLRSYPNYMNFSVYKEPKDCSKYNNTSTTMRSKVMDFSFHNLHHNLIK